MPDWLDFTSAIICTIIIAILFYLIFNGVSVFICYASEGEPHWNKVVFACHFNDSFSQISQTIISQDRFCYQNGVQINCSNMKEAFE